MPLFTKILEISKARKIKVFDELLALNQNEC